MIKNIKRIAALLLALVLCVGFAGCHAKDEIALKISYEQKSEDFTSAFYSCALLNADMEAQSKLSETLSEEDMSKADFDYLKQKIDGKEYSVWVKDRALELCKELFAYKTLCNINNVAAADQLVSAATNAQYYWSYYSELMTGNGVGFETFKKFMQYEEYSTAYFNSLYGEKGKKEVDKATIDKHLKEKYVYVDVLSSDITTLDEKKVTEKENTFKKYIERMKKGENFGKIYAEENSSEYTKNDKDKGIFNNDLATVWGTEGTLYEHTFYSKVSALKDNEPTIVKAEQDGKKYLLLVVKGDIMQEGNVNIDAYKDSVRHELKDDEYNAEIAKFVKDVKLEEIKRATKQFKVEKIVYPQTAY